MAKILVTGGAGFIGSHLVDALLSRGEEVLVIDNLSTGKAEFVHANAIFHKADIREVATQKIIRDFQPSVIYHLAAQKSVPDSFKHPREDAEINLVGLCNMLEALPGSGLQKFIFASTGGAMYGDNAALPATEAQSAAPSAPYGLAKYASERYIELWGKLHGFQSIALRLANVYGPRQDPFGEAGVIAIFCKRAVEGEPMRVFGKGDHTRDYVYVADVVAAFLQALDTDVSGVMNIGTGKETSVLQLIQKLESITQRKFAIDARPEVQGEMARSALQADMAKAKLGWQPRVSLDAGIQETFTWFRQLAQEHGKS